MRLSVHVTPKAGRDEVAGWRAGELQVRVTVAPQDGKANAAVCKTVAAALGIPKTAVTVARGETSRHKSLELEGVNEADLLAAFGAPDPSLF